MNAAEDYFVAGLDFTNKKQFDKAIDSYQKALEIDQKNLGALNNLGLLLSQHKKYEQALELFARAASYDPEYLDALNNWGWMLSILGRQEEAKAKFEKCLQINATYSHALYNLGNLNEEENPALAIDYYQKLIENDPDYHIAFYRLANLYFNQKNFQKARENYLHYVKYQPDHKWAFYYLAKSFVDDPDKSQTYFKRCIEIDPNFIEAYNDWGNVLFDHHQYDTAAKKYQQCLDIDPNYKYAHYNLANCISNQQPEKAEFHFRRCLEIDPDYFHALLELANLLNKNGSHEKAREFYLRSIEVDPDNYIGYYKLARTFENDNPDAAVEYYQKAAERKNDQLDIYYGWAIMLAKQDKSEEATIQYEKCIELNPTYEYAYEGLGLVWMNLDPARALRYFTRQTELTPDQKYGYDNIYYCLSGIENYKPFFDDFKNLVKKFNQANGYWSLGNYFNYVLKDYQQSLEYYRTGSKLDPDLGIALDIANAWESMGNLQEAMKILEASLKKNPQDIYALHNKAHYLFRTGNYQKAWALWREVVRLYDENIAENSEFKNNSNNYLYSGSIQFEVFSNYEKAEKIYQDGARNNPKDIRIHHAMIQLYAEMDRRAINPDLSNYWKRSTLLNQALTLFNQLLKNEENYLSMAEMYFLEGQFDQASAMIEACLAKFGPSFKAFNLQAQLKVEEEAFDAAVKSFKKAISIDPHDLKVRINLGNVYLRNKEYYEAEKIFNLVLGRDPNNVEAYIGLGEINLNRALTSHSTDLFAVAEAKFRKAITLGKSEHGSIRLDMHEPKSKTGERIYKDLKLSDLYYTLGFIKIKLYEQDGLRIGKNLLQESLTFFNHSFDCNPDNLKAINARNQVSGKVKSQAKSGRTELYGGYLITSLSFVLFALCQFFFFFNYSSEHQYRLNPATAEFLGKTLALDENTAAKVSGLSGITFSDKQGIMDALAGIAGEKKISENLALLEKMNLAEGNHEQLLSAGYYALISFGSIIFMIAGLYLPKLLRLKVGVIELEKNSPTEINSISLLGIQR